MLEHLVISPGSGLGNRLRAIASARRLCEMCHARCTVHWTWGNFEDLFCLEPSLDWTPVISGTIEKYRSFTHRMTSDGGTKENRRVWTSKHKGIVVYSCHVFNSYEENTVITSKDLRPWLLRPTPAIQKAVDSLWTPLHRKCMAIRSACICGALTTYGLLQMLPTTFSLPKLNHLSDPDMISSWRLMIEIQLLRWSGAFQARLSHIRNEWILSSVGPVDRSIWQRHWMT